MKIVSILFFLISVSTSNAMEDSEFPKWINELHSNAIKALQVDVSISYTNVPDNLEEGKWFVFCLKGEGSLKKVADPFETIYRMFSSNGWKPVSKYDADGHGSSSFAYEKGNHFCNVSVTTDSSCDDRETGHVPSRFWFEMYCRKK